MRVLQAIRILLNIGILQAIRALLTVLLLVRGLRAIPAWVGERSGLPLSGCLLAVGPFLLVSTVLVVRDLVAVVRLPVLGRLLTRLDVGRRLSIRTGRCVVSRLRLLTVVGLLCVRRLLPKVSRWSVRCLLPVGSLLPVGRLLLTGGYPGPWNVAFVAPLHTVLIAHV